MRNETKIKLAFTIEEAEEIEQALRNCAFDACSQYQRFNELAIKFDKELEALETRDTPFDEEEKEQISTQKPPTRANGNIDVAEAVVAVKYEKCLCFFEKMINKYCDDLLDARRKIYVINRNHDSEGKSFEEEKAYYEGVVESYKTIVETLESYKSQMFEFVTDELGEYKRFEGE